MNLTDERGQREAKPHDAISARDDEFKIDLPFKFKTYCRSLNTEDYITHPQYNPLL